MHIIYIFKGCKPEFICNCFDSIQCRQWKNIC